MNKYKILLYLGIGIMAFHLIIGLSISKYDFSTLGAILILIGYFKYEIWYSFYILLGILILIEMYNDIMLMTTSPKSSKSEIQEYKPKKKNDKK